MAKKKAASPHRVAVVQHPPVLLHRDKTIKRGVELMGEAAAGGARFVSFPETWLPGYPEWVWRLRPGDDYELMGTIHARLLENAVDLKAGHLKPIQAAAKRLKQTVSIGVHERDSEFSRGTLYNTVVLIGPDGEVLNRHRKLMPTNPERMVWGVGDARGLRVIETPAGRIGSLICWENYMPLARFSLFAQGCEVYVAPTWDAGSTWVSTMRHIAAEGRCWVLGNGTAMRGKDIPSRIGSTRATRSSSRQTASWSPGRCTRSTASCSRTATLSERRRRSGLWTSPVTTVAPTSSSSR